MISHPTSVLNLLDEGRIVIRGLIRFDLGGGTYGFIRANAPLIYSGLTYNPGGLLSVSDLSGQAGLSAQKFTITLAESPDDGLTSAILQTIEAEDYRDRPVTISDAYFHPDTGALLHVQALRRGYIDTIEHIESVSSGYTINANCETRAIDYTRTNGRKRSDADQRRRSATDSWLKNASLRGREEIFWGRAKPSDAQNPAALNSLVKALG